MKKTLYYSVRIKDLKVISDKAVVIYDFQNNSDVFPKSAILGFDYEVQKVDAIWVAAWILPKKSVQYSSKKLKWA